MDEDSPDESDGPGQTSSGAQDSWQGWGGSDYVRTPRVTTQLSPGFAGIHEKMVETVKEFDEAESYRTGLRIVSKVQNGPFTYAVISYDTDPSIIDRIEEGGSTTVARSEEALREIEEERRFSVGVSQEVKDIPATNRHMALVKAGSEYQRDSLDVAGIRIVGAEQRDDGTYYKVSFESHREVESQFDQAD